MNLEEYLEELKNCPDNELTSRLGVYDNYPVVLSLDYTAAKKKLQELDRFTIIKRTNSANAQTFNFDDGMHTLTLHNREYNLYYLDKKTEKKIQKMNYRSYFFLHPYQAEHHPFDEQRKMAEMIIYLGKEFLMKQKIPALLPIQGSDVSDASKFVFYSPRKK